MSQLRVTDRELAKGIRLQTNAHHLVVVLPHVAKVALLGMYFATNKNFLLPRGLSRLRQLQDIYRRYATAQLLIVGHTDTSGDPEYNETLSLERAEAMAAYLEDDVAAWLARYDSDVAEAKRWGASEDVAMLRHVLSKVPHPVVPRAGVDELESLTHAFRTQNGISAQGEMDDETRRALIAQYMAEDGTTLPRKMSVTVHGCGEYFPLDRSGSKLDTAAVDGADDPLDRRVELFFFNGQDGIQPPPPGPRSKRGSPEYPAWRNGAKPVGEWTLPLDGVAAARCPSRFSQGCSFPKPSMVPTLRKVAALLRDDALLNVEVIGHTDNLGPRDGNLALSKDRAECVAAWLTHDAAAFRRRFDAGDAFRRWEWEELQWILLAVPIAQRPAYVARVDGYAGPQTHEALALFQATHDLPVTGLADDATLDRLILAYFDLIGPPVPAQRVSCFGAGPDHPRLTFGPRQEVLDEDGSVQQLRRADLFVTTGRMSPPGDELARNADAYPRWCQQVRADVSLPPLFQTSVAFVNERTLPRPGQQVEVLAPTTDGQEGLSIAQGVTDAEGYLAVELPRGSYKVRAYAEDQVLRGALAIDPDVYGAQRIALIPEGQDS